MSPRIYTSPHPAYEIPDGLSFSELMMQQNPDNIPNDKVIHTDTLTGKSVTYGGLREQAAQYAYGLRNTWDMQVQDRILCVIPNSVDFQILTHSVWWAGAVFSAINTTSTVPELTHALTLVQPKFICVHPDYLTNMTAAISASNLPAPPKIMTIITEPKGTTLPHFPSSFTSTPNSTLPPFHPASHNLTPSTATASIFFTSGTTGPTKAAALSHTNLIASVLSMRISHPDLINGHSREAFFPMYW
jgi:4-coumarate--CoA ligase